MEQLRLQIENNAVRKIELTEKCNGLERFVMSELSDSVILCGANGSGKSRILKLLIKTLQNDFCVSLADFSHFEEPLQTPSSFAYCVRVEEARKILSGGGDFSNAGKYALILIQYLAERKEAEKEHLERLNELLYKIMGVKIQCVDGKAQLYGLDLENAGLSPGQKYLLRLCVTLFCYSLSRENINILVLDEPEVHLHPSALLDFFHRLRNEFPSTQFFVATHSPELIAETSVNNCEIWLLKDGEPKKFKSDSEKVLGELFGYRNASYCTSLEQFIVSPTLFAANKFAYESLELPRVLGVGSNCQSQQVFREACELPYAIKIVDFGVGKGRFLGELDNNQIREIDYYAYDKSDKDKSFCIEEMTRKGIDSSHYFNDLKELRKKAGNVDRVIMVNVLHEIDPEKWIKSFKEAHSLLKTDGELLIAEVDEFTYGENASTCGFLVLTEETSKYIFPSVQVSRKDLNRGKELNYERFISIYKVNAEDLVSVSKEKLKEAFNVLNLESLRKIKQLRKQNKRNSPIYISGLRHSFWLHQYVNSHIAHELIR